MATLTPLLSIATSMRSASIHFTRAESLAGRALTPGATAPLHTYNAARAFAAGVDDARRAMTLLSTSGLHHSTQHMADLTSSTLAALRHAVGEVFVAGPSALVKATGGHANRIEFTATTKVVSATRTFASELGSQSAIPFVW